MERKGCEPPVQHLTKSRGSSGAIQSLMVVLGNSAKRGSWTETGRRQLCASGASSVDSRRRGDAVDMRACSECERRPRCNTRGATIRTYRMEEWPRLAERAFTSKSSQWSLGARVERNLVCTIGCSCNMTCRDQQ